MANDTLNITAPKRYTAFHYRDFRLVWFGQLISSAGGQMQMVALNWHIYLLTHSPIALGLLGLARFVPIVGFALFGGLASDRFNRKKLLIVMEIIQTILAAALAVTTFMGTISPAFIYLVSFLSAIILAIELPARQSLIPNLVDKKDITSAISLSNVNYTVSSVLGPALSGFVIAGLGVGSVYAMNAASFIAMIAALLSMRATGDIVGVRAERSWAAINDGIHFVRTHTIIWSTMILDFFCTFFGEATVLLPIFAKDVLQVGPQELGLLYAGPFIGAMIASVAVGYLGEIRKQGKVLLISVVFYAVGTILFGVSRLFPLSILALMIVGAGDGISAIIRSTIRQLNTPDYIRGRMSAINMIFFMGGPQLGEFEAGLLAAAIGAPWSVVIGGASTLIVVGLMTFFIPNLREYKNK